MKKAMFEDEMISAENFIARASTQYKEKGLYARCPSCDEDLFVNGAPAPNCKSYFYHRKRDVSLTSLDDCILADRGNKRLRAIKPKGWDYQRSNIIRNRFLEEDNLKAVFSFMTACCGKGAFSRKSFKVCFDRADKHKIWAYKGISSWLIPYVLLMFDDYLSEKGHEFHFVIRKPGNLWKAPHKCLLDKVFADSGNSFNSQYYKKNANDTVRLPNPLQMNFDNYQRLAGDSSWVTFPLRDFLVS